MNYLVERDEFKAQEQVNEGAAIKSFLQVVNEVIRGNECENMMSDKTALKFLLARKFDIKRAVELYQLHEITRLREGLSTINPNDPDLKIELHSGKFTILKHRDANNSAIALFTAKLHSPNKSSKNHQLRRKIHRQTLQGIVYQLDSALEDVLTQRNGIVFVYNMANSEYSNFDYELCQKILNLLKGAYPAKLKKVLIVSPPLWFKAPFHLLRLIVREKLRHRVWLVNVNQLSDHLPKEALTCDLGGVYEHDHEAWINECNNLFKTRHDDLCDPTSAEVLTKNLNHRSSIPFRRSSQDIANELVNSIESFNQNNGQNNTNRNARTFVYDYDDRGMSLSQFVSKIKSLGRVGLGEEYDSIVNSDEPGTFLVSSSHTNMMKNRYINVKCYDHSRVILEPYDLPTGIFPIDSMDYINANYVDGYRQPKAYISTQGPIERTFMDFWRMIWQTGCRVIVMATLNFENATVKCDQYWPTSSDNVMNVGIYKVEYISLDYEDDYLITHLRLTNNQSEVSRDIWHLQFTSWPDFGVPQTALALLKYRECVLKKQLDAIEVTGGTMYPPIVVHCSAGVGRSGTFVTVDICIQKLETTGLVDVESVVRKLRGQRYSSIQTKEQYIFCYKAIIDYAASCGLLDGIDDLESIL